MANILFRRHAVSETNPEHPDCFSIDDSDLSIGVGQLSKKDVQQLGKVDLDCMPVCLDLLLLEAVSRGGPVPSQRQTESTRTLTQDRGIAGTAPSYIYHFVHIVSLMGRTRHMTTTDHVPWFHTVRLRRMERSSKQP